MLMNSRAAKRDIMMRIVPFSLKGMGEAKNRSIFYNDMSRIYLYHVVERMVTKAEPDDG